MTTRETPSRNRLRGVVGPRPKPGAPIDRALFQAGFPLGVAQRAPQPIPEEEEPDSFRRALAKLAQQGLEPIGAKGFIAATEKAAEEERQRALGRVDPETGRAFPDRPVEEIVQEFEAQPGFAQKRLPIGTGFADVRVGTLLGALQAFKERVAEPSGGVVGTLLSKALTGKPGATETRFDELRSQGFGPFEAARRAFQEAPQPPFVRGAAEMLDPTLAFPGVGFGGGIVKGVTKLAPIVGAKAAPIVREVALRPAQLLMSIPGGAGAEKFDWTTLAGLDKTIKRMEKAAKSFEEAGAAPGTMETVLDDVRGLRELRESMLRDALTPDELARYEAAQLELSATQGGGRTVGLAPRFGTPERAGWELQRRLARERGEVVGVKARTEARARSRARLQATVKDLEEAAEARLAREAPAVVPPPGAPQQVGAIQAGMGIGERPAQGGFFENLRGEVIPGPPLVDVERIQAQAARRAEVARGQAELPAAAKAPWQMTRAEYRLKVSQDIKDLPQPQGTAAESYWATVNRTHRRDVADALSEGKPVPASVLADYPDLVQAAPLAAKPPRVVRRAAAPTTAPRAIPATKITVNVADELAKERQVLASENPLDVAFARMSIQDLEAAQRKGLTTYQMTQQPPAGMKEVNIGQESWFVSKELQGQKIVDAVAEARGYAAPKLAAAPVAAPPPAPTAPVAQARPPLRFAPKPPLKRVVVPPTRQAVEREAAREEAEFLRRRAAPREEVALREAQEAKRAFVAKGQEGREPLPSGRVPGGPRAEPTGPQGVRVVSQGAEPPRPPIEPPQARPSGELPSGRRPGGIGRAGPPPPPKDPLAMIDAALDPQKEPFLKRILRTVPDDWYDSNYALKELESLTGIPARKAAQVVSGAPMKAEEVVRRFYEPAVGEVVNKEYRNLQRLMVLKRIDDIGAINPGSRFPGGLSRADAIVALGQMEKQLGAERFAKISQAADELYRLNDEHMLQELRQEGLISPRRYLEMKTDHPHYIPFRRADFVQDLQEAFSRPVASVGSTGIKKLSEAGSVRALDEPLERLLREPFRVQSLIAKNRASKTIIQALEELQAITGEEMVRWIGPKATFRRAAQVTGQSLKLLKKGEHSQVWETVSFFLDGEKYMADIPARFARAAKGLDAEPLGPVVRFIAMTNQPLRLGATSLNAFFLPVNVIRDAMAAMFRENLLPLGPDHLAGLWAAIRKNSLFTQAANEGALLSGLMENMKGPKTFQRPVLGSITLEKPQDALLLPLRLAALPYRAITGVNIIVERATRLGVYRKLGRIEGLDPLERSVRTRDATVDFSKMGNTMRVVNHVIPFSNAAVQGSANLLRTIRDHPVRSAAYAAMFGGVVAAERLNNQRFETSNLIPDYEYTRNWVFQVGEATRKDGTKYPVYVKIPKGEIASMLTFPVEAMFNWARATEDRSATELLLDSGIEAAKTISPVQDVSSLLPAAGQTLVGLGTGVDPFTGAPIIPRREEALLTEQQFGTETSTVAVALGKALGISPRKIDFAIKDYLAGAGETTNWMLGQFLEIVGFKRPEAFGEGVKPQLEGAELLSRQPGVRRFLGTRASQEERRGWEQFDKSVESTNREVNKLPGLNRLGVRLGEVGDSIGKIELTPAERVRYQELAGQQALELTPILLARQDYQAETDERKREWLKVVLAYAKERARSQMAPLLQGQMQQEAGPPTPASTPTPSSPDRLRAPVGAIP